jgi:hypothetical protein
MASRTGPCRGVPLGSRRRLDYPSTSLSRDPVTAASRRRAGSRPRTGERAPGSTGGSVHSLQWRRRPCSVARLAHRVCLGGLPGPVEGLGTRTIEAHHVVPSWRDRPAVGHWPSSPPKWMVNEPSSPFFAASVPGPPRQREPANQGTGRLHSSHDGGTCARVGRVSRGRIC